MAGPITQELAMDKTFSLRLALPATLLAALLAGCAAAGPHAHRGGGRDYDARGMGGQGGMMDMQAMCEMHKKDMAGKSPAEQQAYMEERMRTMAPEMRERMRTMMGQCR
jgi:hypothetical protein